MFNGKHIHIEVLVFKLCATLEKLRVMYPGNSRFARMECSTKYIKEGRVIGVAMKHILEKLRKENLKIAKIRMRDENKPCRSCKQRMGDRGFSEIPLICKICAREIHT